MKIMLPADYPSLFNEFINKHRNTHPNLLLPNIKPVPIEPKRFTERPYEMIDFEIFLKIKFPESNLFNTILNRDNIENLIKKKFGIFHISVFEQYGELKEVKFDKLKYYQNEVGIEGKSYSNKEAHKPVLAVKAGSDIILFNGYHRSAYLLITNHDHVWAHILDLD